MNNYEILGVAYGSLPDVWKKAYKALVKVHHPDMPGGNQAMFIKIKKAYDELLLGNTGESQSTPPRPPRHNPQTNPNAGVAVMQGKFDGAGNFAFLLMLSNVDQILGLEALEGIEWTGNVVGKEAIGIIIQKELLERCDYHVKIRFTGYNRFYIDKEWKIKKPSGFKSTMKKFFG